MYTEEQENVMVAIPGLRGRPPKEIAVRNLSEIIGARYKEIIDLVYHEIKASGYENKLMTGVVLTGGGSLIKNLKQLVAYVTGKETRIGYPNEHLGPESKDVVVSPMYSTGVGLVLKGFEYMQQHPEQFAMVEDSAKDEKEKKVANEPSLMDRISGWFIEDNVD
jgi:cell division protein FtsA